MTYFQVTSASRYGLMWGNPLAATWASGFCPGEQQLAFSFVAGQLGGATELGARLVVPSELREEIPAHARQEMIILQRRPGADRVDGGESGRGTLCHPDRHRPIELDDRRRRELIE